MESWDDDEKNLSFAHPSQYHSVLLYTNIHNKFPIFLLSSHLYWEDVHNKLCTCVASFDVLVHVLHTLNSTTLVKIFSHIFHLKTLFFTLSFRVFQHWILWLLKISKWKVLKSRTIRPSKSGEYPVVGLKHF